MKSVIALLLLCLLLSSALLIELSPQVEGQILDVPANIIGLMVLNEPARSLVMLRDADLDDVDIDIENLLARLPPPVVLRLQPLSQSGVERASLLVHRLEPRESGSLKIHFSLLLQHSAEDYDRISSQLEELVRALFGPQTQILEDREVRLYRGETARQTIYQISLPGVILLSNSESGWKEVLDTWSGLRPTLSTSGSFHKISQRLPPEEGIFVYFNAPKVLSLMPEFGYQLRYRGREAVGEYFPLP